MVFLGQFTVALCFAELAAHYPLSGGIYQWSRWIGSRGVGWMAGWVYLCGSVISLAAVALALQATLPQIAPAFQLIGDAADRSDSAKNAVLAGLSADRPDDRDQLGRRAADGADQQCRRDCRADRGDGLDRLTRGQHPPRSVGLVRYARPRRGPSRAATWVRSWRRRSWPRMSCTGSTRRAPWPKRPTCPAAALPGRSSRHWPPPAWPARCSCFSASSRSAIPAHPELGRISGGLPFLVKDVLGPRLGVFLLLEVIFAVFVCALAVHAGTVRLMFAMARDNNLPFAHCARPRASVVEGPDRARPSWSAYWPRRSWS